LFLSLALHLAVVAGAMKIILHFLAGPNWPWQNVMVNAGDPIPNVGDTYQTTTGHNAKVVSRSFNYNQDGTELTITFYLTAL
jgi:hypothetical protein